jgi:hypothetical protein
MLPFLYAGRPKELYSSSIMLYMGLNPQPLAQLPVIHSNSILPPPICTKHWNFLAATDPLLHFSLFTGRVRYPLSKPTACLCSSDCTVRWYKSYDDLLETETCRRDIIKDKWCANCWIATLRTHYTARNMDCIKFGFRKLANCTSLATSIGT